MFFSLPTDHVNAVLWVSLHELVLFCVRDGDGNIAWTDSFQVRIQTYLYSLLFGKLRHEEDWKFKTSLDNLVRTSLKIKINAKKWKDCRYGFVVEHLLKTKVCGAVGLQKGARRIINCTVGKKCLCVLDLKKYVQERYFIISSLFKVMKKTGENSQNFVETHSIS